MSNSLEHALNEALDDEYKARATYQAVLEAFGDVRPFSNIVHAEDRHAHALERLFDQHDLTVPCDHWPDQIHIPDQLESCIKLAIEAEIENTEMYDRLLAQTKGYPDVQRVLSNLQRASQENHLPAFQRALGRTGSEKGRGRGRGRGCKRSASSS